MQVLISVVVVVLALVSDDVTSQDVQACECIPYFVCNFTVTEQQKECPDSPYFVCCIVDTTPSIGPVTTSSITTEVPIRSGDGLCGKRVSQEEEEEFVGFKVSGVVNVENEVKKRAVYFILSADDVNTSFGEFPWMVSIIKTTPTGRISFLCGGSIIYPHIILTAAHCVSGVSERSLRVQAGVWDTADPEEEPNHQDRSVATIIIQPGYDGRYKRYANDLAILVLDQPLSFVDHVAPVCLPSPAVPLNTSNCVTTGWGTDSYGKNATSNVLKKVDLPLVDFNSCQNQLRLRKSLGPNFNLHNSFICAGGGKADTCKGDGGGPLICPTLDDPNRYVQVGVTSWGVACGKGPPGVYASTEAAAAWIENTLTPKPL